MIKTKNQVVSIKRVDTDKHIVYGEVYAPNTMDTFKEFMLPEDIEKMAHRFMQLELSETIDTNHDNEVNGSFPVESFIARRGDPDFAEGAWVMGVKVTDGHLWRQVKNGEINGFSFQALVHPVEMVVKIDVIRDHVGSTEEAGIDPHEHLFFAQVDENGRVVRGSTSVVNGHSHDVTSATKTGRAGGHSHRFFLG
jgi:hypothetical protein